jgi:hypothetical protein
MAEKTCCTNSVLDIFTDTPTDISINDSSFVAIETKNNLAENTPIEFAVSKYDQAYLDFSQSYLDICVQIKKVKDGVVSNLAAADNVVPNTDFLNGLFLRCDLEAGGTVLTSSTNTYAYKSYIETLFGYDKFTQEYKFTEKLWMPDTDGKFDDILPTTTNKGALQRKDKIKLSQKLFLRGKLAVDIFNSNKAIPNGVSVNLRLVRNKPDFSLNADLTAANAPDRYIINVLSAKLWVGKIEPSAPAFQNHIEAFNSYNARYNFMHGNIWSKLLLKDTTRHSESNIFSGNVPNFLIFGLVKSKAFLGNYKHNPYNFEHCNINYLAVTIDGKPRPVQNYRFDFANDDYLEGFHSLFDNSLNVPPITVDDYKAGYFFVVADLTNNSSGFTLVNSGPRHGNVDIEITFANPLSENYVLIIYHGTPASVSINKTRAVSKDYFV